MSAARIVDVIKYSDPKQLEEERVCFTLWFLRESAHGLKGKAWWQEQETGQSHDHMANHMITFHPHTGIEEGGVGGREGQCQAIIKGGQPAPGCWLLVDRLALLRASSQR